MGREWARVRRVVQEADVVVEVVDARDPYATRSIRVERLAKVLGKPLLIVINKADLVPKQVLDEWKSVLEKEHPTIYLSATKRLGTRRLWKAIKKLSSGRDYVTVAVVGLPNVGKSAVINLLKGRHSAATSPLPGYTKHPLTVKAATWLKVIDTPGVIPRGSEEELIVRGALRPESLEDPVLAAMKLVEVALSRDQEVFEKTYGIASKDPYEVLEELASRRGFLLKGGELNVEEAARALIRDWQSGKLVFYSKPSDYGLS